MHFEGVFYLEDPVGSGGVRRTSVFDICTTSHLHVVLGEPVEQKSDVNESEATV